MHILYPLAMIILAVVALWVAYKVLRKHVPELRVFEKISDIESTSSMAEKVDGIDLKQAKKDQKTINNFTKE